MRYASLLLACSLAAPVHAAAVVRSHFIAPVESGSYAIDFDDENRLSISCVESCNNGSGIFFREDVASTPTGVLVPYEDQNLLVTTWATGSANLLVIYYLDGNKTRKVFQESMLGKSDIITSGKDGLVIRLVQFKSERSKERILRAWQWQPRESTFTRMLQQR